MFNDKFYLTQAVLDGKKTMTRRKLKIPKTCNDTEVYGFNVLTNSLGTQCVDLIDYGGNVLGSWKPHYEVGEIVAIAQSYHTLNKSGYVAPEWCEHTCESSAGYENKMFVRADLMLHHIKITDVKVERLQDISDEDCLREGIRKCFDHYHHCYAYQYLTAGFLFDCPRETFSKLIDRVSGKGTWKRNPWVVAYSFELVD